MDKRIFILMLISSVSLIGCSEYCIREGEFTYENNSLQIKNIGFARGNCNQDNAIMRAEDITINDTEILDIVDDTIKASEEVENITIKPSMFVDIVNGTVKMLTSEQYRDEINKIKIQQGEI